MKLFHTADFHVGCKTHGKRNPETGLNSRLHDAQDRITALAETANRNQTDLVLFAGDGFEHPSPTPTQQRVFVDAIKQFDAPIVATTGNHDVPATEGRSHALDVLNELEDVHLIDKPEVYVVSTESRHNTISVRQKIPAQSHPKFVLTVLPWPLEHQVPDGICVKQHYLNLLEKGYDRAQELGVPAYCLGHFTVQGSLPSGSEESLQLNGEVTFSPADF